MSDNNGLNIDRIVESFGLLTTIWGPPTWEALHCITFGYPDNPTKEDMDDYYNFFRLLRKVLPCCVCRQHYSQFIVTGETKLTNEVMLNKKTLTYWLWTVHNAVDKQLGMVYNISYPDLCEKYKSYITNCQLTPEMKIVPYKHSYNKEAPIIPYNVALCFIDYAKSRGLTDFEENIKKTNGINKKSDDWFKRNEHCNFIIKDMRINGITCIERSGKVKGFLTVNELKLMQHLSTTMSQKYIMKILEKMGYKLEK